MAHPTAIWAHRGARKDYPENTLLAFQKALALGADGFELDVQRTKDGALVVAHDEDLLRCAKSEAAIVDLTWAELETFNVAAYRPDFPAQTIPLLADVLELVKQSGCTLNIELKNWQEPYPGMEKEVVHLVQSYGLQEQVIYSSFKPRSVHRLSRLVDKRFIGYLYDRSFHNPVLVSRIFGAHALHPGLEWTSRELIEQAHAAGCPVHVWTVNEEEDIRRLLDWGVDAIITDDPALALSIRDAK